MKNRLKSQIVCLLCLLFSLLSLTQLVYADEASGESTLTLSYKDSSEEVSGAQFFLYKLGTLSKDGELVLEKVFKDYPINLKQIDQSEWNEYANTLKTYIKKDKVLEDAKIVTNVSGVATATLKNGLYLIVGEDLQKNGHTYKTSPFIVALPKLDKETGTYFYTVNARPKFSKEGVPPSSSSRSLHVLKVWEDEGHKDKRPTFIEVDLLENGEVKETVILDKNNNWRYAWNHLSPFSTWTVVEKNLDKEKYSLKIKEEGFSIILTNTYLPPSPPENPPTKTPPTPTPPKPPSPPKVPPSIPQTGQLWWPVYLLSGLGSILIFIGLIRERKKGEKK